jgi:hypothetical protein
MRAPIGRNSTRDRVLIQSLIPALVIVMSICAGCAFRQSEKVRAASFFPHLGRRIEGMPVAEFLNSRMALLVSCDQLPANPPVRENLKIPSGSAFGCAAAVDTRGYFLTAAHCLKSKETYLMLFDSNALWVLRARVIWQTAHRSGQPDLAVLHIPRHLNHAFALGDEVRNGEPVLAVGLAWTNAPEKRLRGFALMAGKVLDQTHVNGVAGFRSLATDVPLQSGDSGGPLVNKEGRLIGINVRGTPPLIHKVMPAGVFPMVAHLPSEVEMRRLIEEDFTSHCSEGSTPFEGHSKQPRPGAEPSSHMERIVVSQKGHGFVTRESQKPFQPWGMNYGNSHRLMEDFWDVDWESFASDFREMKALGANVVRVHLQYGNFMKSPVEVDPQAINNYQRMVKLAEEVGIYLDVTGLACYRPSDVPEWYDAMDEQARWEAQARLDLELRRFGCR